MYIIFLIPEKYHDCTCTSDIHVFVCVVSCVVLQTELSRQSTRAIELEQELEVHHVQLGRERRREGGEIGREREGREGEDRG